MARVTNTDAIFVAELSCKFSFSRHYLTVPDFARFWNGKLRCPARLVDSHRNDRFVDCQIIYRAANRLT